MNGICKAGKCTQVSWRPPRLLWCDLEYSMPHFIAGACWFSCACCCTTYKMLHLQECQKSIDCAKKYKADAECITCGAGYKCSFTDSNNCVQDVGGKKGICKAGKCVQVRGHFYLFSSTNCHAFQWCCSCFHSFLDS